MAKYSRSRKSVSIFLLPSFSLLCVVYVWGSEKGIGSNQLTHSSV